MSLTKENIETSNAAIDHGAMIRDLGRMDQVQLGDFVRKAAIGIREDDFLPHRFFGYFNAEAHGSSYDGRSAPGLADFLVETYEIVGLVERGVYSLNGEPADFGFRGRFRRVITEFLDELSDIKSLPSVEQIKLAGFAVEAVETFSRMEWKSSGYPSGTLTDRLRQDMEELEVVKPNWTQKAQLFIDSGRFGQLTIQN